MGENRYVKDEWGKRGTYRTTSTEEIKKPQPKFAAGDSYDRIGPKPMTETVNPRRKHKGLRFLLAVVVIIFLATKIDWNRFSSIQLKTPDASAELQVEQSGGMRLNYRVKQMLFQSEKTDEAEVAIRDFLNLYQIDYTNLYYDEENHDFVVLLNYGGVFTTEEDVKEKAEELQSGFQTYCRAKGTSYGITGDTVTYEYTRVNY